jgi:hypothetical protein
MSRPDLVVYLDSLLAAEASRSRWSGRPRQVLHDQQQRRGGGQLLDHPEQPLEQPPLPGTRHRSTCGRLAAPGQVGQQPAQLLPGRTRDRLQLRRVELVGQAAQCSVTGTNGRPSSSSGT